MTYGTIKVDTVTFTDAGVDKSVTLSGLVQNPTFSGNVTVTGTLSGVTVTGTTANFTSGNFTNISGGTHTITSGVFAAGSAASPSITFTGDLNTGIYSPGADQVAISTGGSGRLFVDASGKITTNVAAATGTNTIVEFSGTSANSTSPEIKVSTTSAFNANFRGIRFGIAGDTTDYSGVRFHPNAGELRIEAGFATWGGLQTFYTNGSERLRIDSSGRVGIGVSSPSDRLHVAGGGIFSTTTTAANLVQVRNSDFTSFGYFGVEGPTGGVTVTGSLANATLISSGAAGTPLQFGTAGVIRATLTSTGLGIGTASPTDAQLYVNSSSTYGVRINHATLPLQSFLVNGTQAFTIGANSGGGGSFYYGTGNVEAARIDSSGRVGIGTSTPQASADIRGTASASAEIVRVGNGTKYIGIGTEGTNYSWIQSFASTSLCLNPLGNNVGIGTTSPNGTLDINNGSTVFSNSGTYIGGIGRANGLIGGTTSELAITTSAAQGLLFGINNTERARIDSSGRLLVGTSTSIPTFGVSPQFEVAGGEAYQANLAYRADAFAPYISIGHSRSASVGTHTILQNGDDFGTLGFVGSDGSSFVRGATISAQVDGTPGANDMPGRLVFSTTADGASSPTERMRIANDGKMGFGTTTLTGKFNFDGSVFLFSQPSGAGNSTLKFNTSTGAVTYDTSSRLVKQNIEDCPYGLAELAQLKPRKYFRTDDQKVEIGFVADEVADVLPEFVPIGPKHIITKNEADTEEIPLGVNYEKLTAVLTKALQEAIGEIELLKARVAALESA